MVLRVIVVVDVLGDTAQKVHFEDHTGMEVLTSWLLTMFWTSPSYSGASNPWAEISHKNLRTHSESSRLATLSHTCLSRLSKWCSITWNGIDGVNTFINTDKKEGSVVRALILIVEVPSLKLFITFICPLKNGSYWFTVTFEQQQPLPIFKTKKHNSTCPLNAQTTFHL